MIILSLMCSVIIYTISCLLQNFHLFVSSQTMRILPGPFIGSTASFLLQKPEGNSNNNNNNNNNNSNSNSDTFN